MLKFLRLYYIGIEWVDAREKRKNKMMAVDVESS